MTPPVRIVNFHEAALRHLADAKLLESNKRLPNAGYLYGYAAECGLKFLLVAHEYPTDSEGSPAKSDKFRSHIDRMVITNTFTTLGNYLNSRSGAKYLAMIPNIGDFSDWHVGHRYFTASALPDSFSRWQAAAHQVGRMLDQARIDGKI